MLVTVCDIANFAFAHFITGAVHSWEAFVGHLLVAAFAQHSKVVGIQLAVLVHVNFLLLGTECALDGFSRHVTQHLINFFFGASNSIRKVWLLACLRHAHLALQVFAHVFV